MQFNANNAFHATAFGKKHTKQDAGLEKKLLNHAGRAATLLALTTGLTATAGKALAQPDKDRFEPWQSKKEQLNNDAAWRRDCFVSSDGKYYCRDRT